MLHFNRVKGAGHNDIEQYKSYFERLANFLQHDVNQDKWHEEKPPESEKRKIRTKDLKDDFEEIQSNDDLQISLTISKTSSPTKGDSESINDT